MYILLTSIVRFFLLCDLVVNKKLGDILSDNTSKSVTNVGSCCMLDPRLQQAGYTPTGDNGCRVLFQDITLHNVRGDGLENLVIRW